MENLVLSTTELTQLAALGPCIFLVIYLLFSARDLSLALIPIIYFLSLTATFLLPIMLSFPQFPEKIIEKLIIVNEHTLPELSFLLIAQLIFRRHPPIYFWAILILPILGEGPLLYLSSNYDSACLASVICTKTSDILKLYHIFAGSMVFLLITVILAKNPRNLNGQPERLHKYWLIIMLIVYNLVIISSSVMNMMGRLNSDEMNFIRTMVGVTFVYLVLSSVFRVFHRNFRIVTPAEMLSDKDIMIVNKINVILDEKRPYLNQGFNRGDLSDMLGLTEQHLSRIINHSFGKSFTDLMNQKRISYAKRLLQENKLSVTDIAFMCGFNSIATFNRVFKASTDITPREFRNKHLQH